jgi:hypothetical protein
MINQDLQDEVAFPNLCCGNKQVEAVSAFNTVLCLDLFWTLVFSMIQLSFLMIVGLEYFNPLAIPQLPFMLISGLNLALFILYLMNYFIFKCTLKQSFLVGKFLKRCGFYQILRKYTLGFLLLVEAVTLVWSLATFVNNIIQSFK